MKLGEGRLNIVIVMIEPCNSHATLDYESMVARSPALQEVDRLIREYSEDCSIDDVPILEARPLISEDMKPGFGEEWPSWEQRSYQVFEEMLRLRKPDVILCLQGVTSNAESLLAKQLSGTLLASPRPSLVQFDGHTALMFRAFHPSWYLTPDYLATMPLKYPGEPRARLGNCFKAAFMARRGQRSVRWNNYNMANKPWQFLCEMAAYLRQKHTSYAKSMRPSQLYCNMKLVSSGHRYTVYISLMSSN
jgi:hypothetical protein